MRTPFTLEEYKANPERKVVIEQGLPARIICTDVKDKKHPILAAFEIEKGKEVVFQYTKNGKTDNSDSNIDLYFDDPESEDEKVRKWLIDWAKACEYWRKNFSVTREQVLAWLEKQGEQKAEINDEWIEDYWRHKKVNNPYSYDKGDEIQFDHNGFVGFCKRFCQKPAKQPEPGIQILSSDEILVTDEHCRFVLHRPAKDRMNFDDANKWAKERGWRLPDRQEGIAISKYKEEIRKAFELPDNFYWFWTCESIDTVYAWYIYFGYGYVYDYDRSFNSCVLAVSAFQY